MDTIELRIVKKFLDPYYDIETDEQFTECLSKINSSEPLHYLASEINWAGDLEAINYVINHPNCDRGTALLVYWYNQPGFWCLKNESELDEYELESFKLHRELEKRLLGAFYKQNNISFDPYTDHGLDWVSSLNKKELENIPPSLIKMSEGKKLSEIDWEKI